MKRSLRTPSILLSTALFAMLFAMCHKADENVLQDESRFDPRLSGGATTIFDAGSRAFTHMIPGLSEYDEYIHELGDKMFEQSFVASPAPLYNGLGPIFNNVSCASCHHNDGIGIPTAGQVNSGLLIRLSMPGTDEHGGPMAIPGFGGQLQDVPLFGIKPEATVNISYTEEVYTFPDGEKASLRKPTYTLVNPYMPLPAGYMISPRFAPPVFGLGLLENLPEASILANADPNDANGDGISGRPNYVYNPFSKKTELGRFGWKANTANILVQVSAAFQQDMGITSYVFPKESCEGQTQWESVKEYTDKSDLQDSMLNAVKFYVQTLSVPARRNVTDAKVKRGEMLFAQIGCASCHTPTMYTDVNVAIPALSHQRIHAYTDMLVHDMGNGLADKRPDYQADGKEWRTAPLWGVGLLQNVNGIPYYLHDGRARTLVEAILWHGGEANNSKSQFSQLSKADRNAVISFLQSL